MMVDPSPQGFAGTSFGLLIWKRIFLTAENAKIAERETWI
jgi:hypothetical protein